MKNSCARKSRKLQNALIGLVVIVAACLTFMFIGQSEAKSTTRSARQVLVISIDHVSLTELLQNKMFQELAAEGATAILAARTGGAYKDISRSNAYASISAGDKLSVPHEAGTLIFNSNEFVESRRAFAKELYVQRTGHIPKSEIIAIALPELMRNEEAHETTGITLLAQKLKESDIKIAVFGNADDYLTIDRSFALSLIDQNGEIDNGDISKRCVKDAPLFPGGKVTDYEYILFRLRNFFMNQKNNRSLVWVETGDTARLERHWDDITPQQYKSLKEEAINRTARFVGKAKNLLNLEKDAIIILSAASSKERVEEETNLTVLIALGYSFHKNTFLYANATRQTGLITISDVAPTIVSLFGVPTKDFVGGVAGPKGQFTKEYLTKLDNKFANVAGVRASSLTIYVTILIIAIIIATAYVVFGREIKLHKPLYSLLLTLVSFPLALLLTSPLFERLSWGTSAIAAICSLASGIGFAYLKNSFRPFVAIGAISAFVVVADTFLGSPLAKFSPLGYSPMIAARFYGIGNEYMGIVVGGSLFLIFALVKMLDAKGVSKNALLAMTIALMVFFVAALGHPKVGANVGGALSATIAYVIAFLCWKKGKITMEDGLKAVMFMFVVLLLLMVVSLFFPYFHLAKALSQLGEGKIEAIVDIALRKLAINLKLLRYTIWSNVLLALIIAFPLLTIHPPGLLSRVMKKIRPYDAAIVGTAFGAVAAFLLNDSGVVAAATLSIFASLGMLSKAIEEKLLSFQGAGNAEGRES